MLKFSDHFFHPRLLWMIAVLYMLCAIMRLARFNLSHDTIRDMSPSVACPRRPPRGWSRPW